MANECSIELELGNDVIMAQGKDWTGAKVVGHR